MDWLGAQAIHRSRLHADRLAEDRSSKRLDLRAELLQKKAEIENEIVDHAIERKTKIEEAQLNEDEKEQVQQDLDALQSTREEEDVDQLMKTYYERPFSISSVIRTKRSCVRLRNSTTELE